MGLTLVARRRVSALARTIQVAHLPVADQLDMAPTVSSIGTPGPRGADSKDQYFPHPGAASLPHMRNERIPDGRSHPECSGLGMRITANLVHRYARWRRREWLPTSFSFSPIPYISAVSRK